jgi:hypothetical protein
MPDQAQKEKNQEHEEDDLGNPRRSRGYAREAQECRDNRNHQET